MDAKYNPHGEFASVTTRTFSSPLLLLLIWLFGPFSGHGLLVAEVKGVTDEE
jgi:hypothetical protein